MKMIVIFISAILVLYSCGDDTSPAPVFDAEAPRLVEMSRDTASCTELITLYGQNFGDQSGSKLFINDIQITDIIKWNEKVVEFYIPVRAVSGQVFMRANDKISNSLDIVVPEESLLRLENPFVQTGCIYVGDTLLVEGCNLGNTQGSKRITFTTNDITREAEILNWSNYEVTILLTPDLLVEERCTGKLDIEYFDGNETVFYQKSLSALPLIDSLSPAKVFAGMGMELLGKFGTSELCDHALYLDGKEIPIKYAGASKLTFNVPMDAKSGKLQYRVTDKWSNIADLIVVDNLIIDDVQPTMQKAGDIITITGRNFGQDQNSSSIYMSGEGGKKFVYVPEYISWSDNEIKIKIPEYASPGGIYVLFEGILQSNVYTYIMDIGADLQTLLSFKNVSLGGPPLIANYDGLEVTTTEIYQVSYQHKAIVTIDESASMLSEYYTYRFEQDLYGDVGSTNIYGYEGRNMLLVHASEEKYVFRSSKIVPSILTSGSHTWSSRTRQSGGRIIESSGSKKLTICNETVTFFNLE